MPFMPRGRQARARIRSGKAQTKIVVSLYQQLYAGVIRKSLILRFLFG